MREHYHVFVTVQSGEECPLVRKMVRMYCDFLNLCDFVLVFSYVCKIQCAFVYICDACKTSVVLFLLFVERTVYMQNWEQLVQ